MYELSMAAARRIWLRAQRLDQREPFGHGPAATQQAVEQLGYVQIDTIHVIERCHHHILWSRIPDYRRQDLHHVQSVDKSVFEYWTHALAYIPTQDLRFFLPNMKRERQQIPSWFSSVTPKDISKVLRLIRTEGPLTIQDIKDDVLVEKDHLWASRKPSKRALQLAFFRGQVTVSQRAGMLKTYDLMDRHFGWETPPRPVTERQFNTYLIDRALRSQGVVSLDSICYHAPKRKPAVRALLEGRVRRKELVPVAIDDSGTVEHWAAPETLDAGAAAPAPSLVHILSPFDPLIIQRKRLKLLFDYDHLFEAYVPKDKRVYGYFTLPVLVGDEIVASLDLKTDRAKGALLIQQWNWFGRGADRTHRKIIEEELDRFERFQLQP